MFDQVTLKLSVDPLILSALKEDVTSEDVTTNSVMPKGTLGEVDLICKEDGIICGLQVFARAFQLLDESTKVELFVEDGDEVKAGQLMGKVTGDIRVLLVGERTGLNYLQRMSGIATYTKSIAKLLEGSKTKLLDTRKTSPNNRIFEKYAVRVGGGNNHRYNLTDGDDCESEAFIKSDKLKMVEAVINGYEVIFEPKFKFYNFSDSSGGAPLYYAGLTNELKGNKKFALEVKKDSEEYKALLTLGFIRE